MPEHGARTREQCRLHRVSTRGLAVQPGACTDALSYCSDIWYAKDDNTRTWMGIGHVSAIATRRLSLEESNGCVSGENTEVRIRTQRWIVLSLSRTWHIWVVSLDSVDEIRTTRTYLLCPPEARDTIHLRRAPSAPVVRRWRPAVRVSKRRNSLTRCAPWPQVIRFSEPHLSAGLDRPTVPAGMTDAAWTIEALLSSRVPRDVHAQLDQ